MKLMIASDLHGSLYYSQKMFDRFDAEKPEKLILLGDLLYHGARNELPEGYNTKGLTALLNAHKDRILAVRGNCDAEIDQTVLEFPIMADYLEMYVDGHRFVITHGHVVNEDRMLPHEPGTVLLHGHTHLKVLENRGDFFYVNPGSVSIPKDPDGIGSYMIYEDGKFTIRDLEGNDLKSLRI
jgi:putative phosphoesterase